MQWQLTTHTGGTYLFSTEAEARQISAMLQATTGDKGKLEPVATKCPTRAARYGGGRKTNRTGKRYNPSLHGIHQYTF